MKFLKDLSELQVGDVVRAKTLRGCNASRAVVASCGRWVVSFVDQGDVLLVDPDGDYGAILVTTTELARSVILRKGKLVYPEPEPVRLKRGDVVTLKEGHHFRVAYQSSSGLAASSYSDVCFLGGVTIGMLGEYDVGLTDSADTTNIYIAKRADVEAAVESVEVDDE